MPFYCHVTAWLPCDPVAYPREKYKAVVLFGSGYVSFQKYRSLSMHYLGVQAWREPWVVLENILTGLRGNRCANVLVLVEEG